MNFKKDLSIFFKYFGIETSLKRDGEEPQPLVGIFDNEYYEVSDEPFAGVSTSSPRFTCVSEEVIGSRGAKLTLGDDVYMIVDIQDDGTGMTTLVMEKQP